MRRPAALAVALGGMAGATVRWAVFGAWPTNGRFPWPVLVVDVVGSFVVGLALGEEARHPSWELWARDALGVGFCGGLTTFSTLSVGAAELVRDGHATTAAVYVVATVVVGILAAVAGAATRRRVGALRLPLEGGDG